AVRAGASPLVEIAIVTPSRRMTPLRNADAFAGSSTAFTKMRRASAAAATSRLTSAVAAATTSQALSKSSGTNGRRAMTTPHDVAFDVDLVNARFSSVETIRVELAQPTRSIVLNAAEISFREVTIESGTTRQTATVTLSDARQTATFTVPRQLPKGPAQIHIT